MSKEKSKSEYPVPVEPPELVAKRDRLLSALEKESKSATGGAQQVLRKMFDLLSNTKVGAPLNLGLYTDVKNAFMRFMKEPMTAPPPMIIMECVEFMQERLVAVGFTGQMEWPEGAPPIPPEMNKPLTAEGLPAAAPAPAAAAPRAGGSKDGFEGGGSQRRMTLNPETAAPPPAAAAQQKAEPQKELEGFKAWMKNPALGKLKG